MIGALIAIALQAASPSPASPPPEQQKAQILRQMGYSDAALPGVESLIDQLQAAHGRALDQLNGIRAQIDQESAASQPNLARLEALLRQQQSIAADDQKQALDLIFTTIRTLSPADQKIALRTFFPPPPGPNDGPDGPGEPPQR